MKLSIVTATFNDGERLRGHCASVLRQSFRDYEHIIVDNLSTDGTKEVVEDYRRVATHPVLYVREPDHGIYQAVNKGIRKARGEWIHVLHGDNAYHSTTSLEDVFKRNLEGYDLVACGEILVKNGREIYMKPEHDPRLGDFKFPHQSTFTRKIFHEKHGYYSERFRIVSDSIYRNQHYRKARWLIIDQPVVVSIGGGLSGRHSLTNTMETIIDYLFFHNYPPHLRLYWAAVQVRGYVRHLLGHRKGEPS